MDGRTGAKRPVEDGWFEPEWPAKRAALYDFPPAIDIENGSAHTDMPDLWNGFGFNQDYPDFDNDMWSAYPEILLSEADAERDANLENCEPVDGNMSTHDLELIAPEPSMTHSSLTTTPGFGAEEIDHDERVCFGMLPEVRCQQIMSTHSIEIGRFAVAAPLPANLRLDDKHVLLTLRKSEKRTMLFLAGTHALANLNLRTAYALDETQKDGCSDVMAYGASAPLQKIFTAAAPTRKHPREFTVYVNVYGRKSQAGVVGARLSNLGLFLQNPVTGQGDLEYFNPHVWSFEGLSEADILLEEIRLGARAGEKYDDDNDWGLALNKLPQYHMQSAQTDNSSLLARLLPHQLDAQDFMISREVGNGREALKYWQPGSNDDGESIYRHIVTMAERHKCQLEPPSGILADEMGLGKTLTALSLVASSTDRATHHGSSSAQYGTPRGIRLTPTKTTLVVAPSLLILDGWIEEIKEQLQPGALKYTRYHGHERVRHFSELLGYDVVFTTYGTITTEFRRIASRKALYHLRWFRIILDEAHTIRSQNTKQFDAIITLEAAHYWCLTGTPISNKVEDLGALLRFCRVPFLNDPKLFRQHVVKIARKSFKAGCIAVQKALAPLCIRRTKELLDLPEPLMSRCTITLSDEEARQYKAVMHHCRRSLDAAVSGNDHLNSRHTVLQSILQLRIFCNHGTFMQIPHLESENTLDPDEALTLMQEKDEAHCSSCQSEIALINQFQDPASGFAATCSHTFCMDCLRENTQDAGTGGAISCPVCEKDVQGRDFAPSDVFGDGGARASRPQTTSKLERLVQNLKDFQGREKSLVFSSWKKTIDLASRLCNGQGIKHVCIHGETPQSDRTRALEQFTNDTSTSVLLMTLGTGALGLNLTAAKRVHILEPQWNPAVEEQAIGRVVRIGQESETTVIRYVVLNTVEEHVQTYQRRKVMLAAGGFGDASAASAEMQTRLLTATFFKAGG